MRIPLEDAAITRLPLLGGVSTLRATYREHVFTPHSHDTFAIGVFEQGAAEIQCEGDRFTAGPGTVLCLNPGVVHSARSATSGGWRYRAFYPDPDALKEELGPDAGSSATPEFQVPLLRDPRLATGICRALTRLEGETAGLALDEIMSALIHGLWRTMVPRPPREASLDAPDSVRRVREFIDAHVDRALSLAELATVAGLSRYHLVRTFSAHVGLSPYAYFLQQRIRRARLLLERGCTPSETSCRCGFADQSHLTRQFKRVVGVTPGEYASAMAHRPH